VFHLHNSASSSLADRCTFDRNETYTTFHFFHLPPLSSWRAHRPDEKTARDLNITAGAVLHLVLALRGGR
jgi:hypothetical protein